MRTIALFDVLCLLAVALLGRPPAAQEAAPAMDPAPMARASVPQLRELMVEGLPGAIQRFEADWRLLGRFYDAPLSSARTRSLGVMLGAWEQRLAELDFDSLDVSGRVDYLLLKNKLRHHTRKLILETERQSECLVVLGFAARIVDLQESRRRMEALDPEHAAGELEALVTELGELERSLKEGLLGAASGRHLSPQVARRAADYCTQLKRALGSWFVFYDAYDPLFSWWVREPYSVARDALERYEAFLRDEAGGLKERQPGATIGQPIGRVALLAELENEMSL